MICASGIRRHPVPAYARHDTSRPQTREPTHGRPRSRHAGVHDAKNHRLWTQRTASRRQDGRRMEQDAVRIQRHSRLPGARSVWHRRGGAEESQALHSQSGRVVSWVHLLHYALRCSSLLGRRWKHGGACFENQNRRVRILLARMGRDLGRFERFHPPVSAGNGHLDLFEIIMYMQKFYEHLFLKTDEESGMKVVDEERLKKFATLLRDSVDKDSDGLISQQEFVRGYCIWNMHLGNAETSSKLNLLAADVY